MDHNTETAANAGTSGEKKLVRIPLQIFQNRLDRFPKVIADRATKAGVETRNKRTWGPQIAASDRELNQIFEVAEKLYHDNDLTKNEKTFAYQLRSQIAKLIGREVNVRKYNRKPKAETSEQPIMQMAAAMPPRENITRASTTISGVLTILEDNDQKGLANLLRPVLADLALPEEVSVDADTVE